MDRGRRMREEGKVSSRNRGKVGPRTELEVKKEWTNTDACIERLIRARITGQKKKTDSKCKNR